MKKKNIIKFSQKNVDEFCKLTKDKNILHFENRFRKPIVPGIMIISKVNEIISKKFNGALITDVIASFRLPLYVNELVNLSYSIKVVNKKRKLYELKAIVENNKNIYSSIKIIILLDNRKSFSINE